MEKQIKQKPVISVVTVCYNAASVLEQTILSVLNQTYPNIEYIIIDGESKDSTVDIIKRYADRLDYWISESDKGVYDAMNKGIKVATGQWINFMNSGDSFYNMNVLTNLVEQMDQEADIIFGDVNRHYDWGEVVTIPESLDSMLTHLFFCHQSCFVKTELMKKEGFTTKYKIAGDYNFFYGQYVAKKKFQYVHLCVANYNIATGLASNRLEAMRENAIINGKITELSWRIHFFLFSVKFRVKELILKMIPQDLLKRIRRRRAHLS